MVTEESLANGYEDESSARSGGWDGQLNKWLSTRTCLSGAPVIDWYSQCFQQMTICPVASSVGLLNNSEGRDEWAQNIYQTHWSVRMSFIVRLLEKWSRYGWMDGRMEQSITTITNIDRSVEYSSSSFEEEKTDRLFMPDRRGRLVKLNCRHALVFIRRMGPIKQVPQMAPPNDVDDDGQKYIHPFGHVSSHSPLTVPFTAIGLQYVNIPKSLVYWQRPSRR